MTDPYKAAEAAHADAIFDLGQDSKHALRAAVTAALVADRKRSAGYWITRFRQRWLLWVGGWEEPNCGGWRIRRDYGLASPTPVTVCRFLTFYGWGLDCRRVLPATGPGSTAGRHPTLLLAIPGQRTRGAALMLREQPFLIGGDTWLHVWDGNPTAAALYDRHYSRNPKARGDPRIAGPGEKMVLLTPCARALFVWRKFVSKDAQQGINCAIFRNEGAGQSSGLIRAAMAAAWARWPGERFYTYVNPRRVRSANPGYCFKRAGWRLCGVTKTRRLLILEALP